MFRKKRVATQYESGNGRVNWRYLPGSNEVIWYSEREQLGPSVSVRSGRPGKLKNQITSGDWHGDADVAGG